MDNRTRNNLIIMLVIIGVGYYFFQNTNFSSTIDQVGKSINNALQEDFNASSNSALNEKLNAYADLINHVNENASYSYTIYNQWVDTKTGPTGKEPNIYGLYKLNADDIGYFAEADRLATEEPKIALDDLYQIYVQKYQKLKPLVDQAHNYYDQKNYQDDNMAQGKAMHTGLVKAFEDFLSIADQFSVEYGKIGLIERNKALQNYQESGRQVAYASTNVLITGQQVFAYLEEEMGKNDYKIESLSADGFKTQVDQFEKAFNELNQITKDKPDEVENEYGITGESLMNNYITSASVYLKSMKTFYRSLRDKQYIDGSTFADRKEGTPENLIYTYNTMVGQYNFMNQF